MDQFLISLIVAMFIGGVAGYLGSLLITTRMALVGDALGHVALPGMGLALLFNVDISLGAVISLFFGILLIWFLGLKTTLPTEALVGIIFVVSLAIGFLIIPEIEIVEALAGDISRLSFASAIISIILSITVFWGVKRIYPCLILSYISEDLAKIQGIKIKKYELTYLFLIGIIVALGVKITGSLLVGALLIIPAAASRNFSKNLKGYSFFSGVIGILSSVLGILAFKFLNLPAGPLIILSSALFFLISFIFKR